MRTLEDIKKEMTDAFMADPTIRVKYELNDGDTFNQKFSVVSIERLLFFIVASAHYVLERIFDEFRKDVMKQIETSVVATVPWYYRQALNFQMGDELKLDEATLKWHYPIVNADKRIVRYASVTDKGGSIQVLVAKDNAGVPTQLSEDELRAFKAYMTSIKMAGVVIGIKSLPADTLSIHVSVVCSPLVYLPNGTRISDGKKPVEEAIEAYLKGITYGGVFNKTKLIDAIQAVDGVIDVELGACSATADGGTPQEIQGNNYSSRGGAFVAPSLGSTIRYNYG